MGGRACWPPFISCSASSNVLTLNLHSDRAQQLSISSSMLMVDPLCKAEVSKQSQPSSRLPCTGFLAGDDVREPKYALLLGPEGVELLRRQSSEGSALLDEHKVARAGARAAQAALQLPPVRHSACAILQQPRLRPASIAPWFRDSLSSHWPMCPSGATWLCLAQPKLYPAPLMLVGSLNAGCKATFKSSPLCMAVPCTNHGCILQGVAGRRHGKKSQST